MPKLHWDIFCQVIDNHGDLGVCWRLASQVAARGYSVRLWIDDAAALAWMAPAGAEGVQLREWGSVLATHEPTGDWLIEAFGCDIPEAFIADCAERVKAGAEKPVWINLEYLSAQAWVSRNHRLPSPVQHGPAAGWTKWFFYPGFTEGTGGLLREEYLAQRQQAFDRDAWRAAQVGSVSGGAARWVSLFCYEPIALDEWLLQCANALPQRTCLMVTHGRAQVAVGEAQTKLLNENDLSRFLDKGSKLSILNIPALTQTAYDELLWASDLNFVRGEDSLVRALWAGKPFVWHIYPQDDGAHSDKLTAFLDWLQAPESWRRFHQVWNGLVRGPLPLLDDSMLSDWADCVLAARAQLFGQTDLLSQLLGFCVSKR